MSEYLNVRDKKLNKELNKIKKKEQRKKDIEEVTFGLTDSPGLFILFMISLMLLCAIFFSVSFRL